MSADQFNARIEYHSFFDKAQEDYQSWDDFRYHPLPLKQTKLSINTAWAILRWERFVNSTPLKMYTEAKRNFSYYQTRTIGQLLNVFDVRAMRLLSTFASEKLTEQERNSFLINSISEEAIATSQIEGANTTRMVGKELLLSGRAPRGQSEQMLVNSYVTLKRLEADWSKIPLSRDLLMGIQDHITSNTIGEEHRGRFRTDADNIKVCENSTGEVVFVPPSEQFLQQEIDRLIEFANEENDGGQFLHPLVKAEILHFWLAYLHPFVDGNGRTARMIVVWYLLRSGYDISAYLSISRAIAESKSKYYDSFLKTEQDENDLTYFLLYNLRTCITAIDKFENYFKRKRQELQVLEYKAQEIGILNSRQLSLLQQFISGESSEVDVKTYQIQHHVAQLTAQNDLIDMVAQGLLAKTKRGRKFVFLPNMPAIQRKIRL